MSKLKQARKFAKKATALATVFGMAASLIPAVPMQAKAADFTGQLTEVKSVEVDRTNKNIVMVTFNNNVKGKITFLEDGIFRYNVDPSGQFSKYAAPNDTNHKGRIPQYPDESSKYSHPEAAVTSSEDAFTVKSGDVSIIFDKATAKMTIKENNQTVMEEEAALTLSAGGTAQTIKKRNGENFYGGGTQNGRFVHTGEVISIANQGWTDGGVASPNPFYYSTSGYGVLRNTFKMGNYDFAKSNPDAVVTTHNSENEFDAYYFVAKPGNGREVTQEILQDYYKVTGNPALAPEYSFYLGHLNAYNRDAWSKTRPDELPPDAGLKGWTIKGTDSSSSAGTTLWEVGMDTKFVLQDGMMSESLNGTKPTVAIDNYPNVTTPREYSARAVIDQYVQYDMPLGYFLPNDGYGAGYGQNGYWKTGGVNADGSSTPERIAAVDANVENLREFAAYAKGKGVETGLWTQSYLVPDSNPATEWHRLRDFRKEVKAGVTTLKTDVAWVGDGYSMQLDGVKTAYDIATEESGVRPNIVSLCGWAGSQRYNGIWTGDQYGGDWEYIRFHIPTYIGTSLSGNPNVGSDMDGIFAGSPLITVRDYQWKTFTQSMLNMDGWGTYAKMPYTFGDPYTGINRMYLKIKSQLMPYLYTTAYSASNIDVGNNDTGLPMVRAMHLEYPDEPYAYGKSMQYQYMYGKNVLVAPVYQDTAADEIGNDVRDNIFLPGRDNIWIDFFTGKQYKGGQNLSGFDAPVWKLPVFVKNGAIIPQYEANNNPSEINKANRIVEFWPAGNTDYTAVEDDGKFVENTQNNSDTEYGVIEDVSYGTNVKTKYTSSVNGDTAVLKAEKSTGSYTGYNKDKNTTFVVHVSKEPTSIVAKNGTSTLTAQKAASKDAFDKTTPQAGQAVWFYDANPKIETFASDKETQFKAMVENVKVAPKLYVKFATVDAQAADQTLEINGFENKGEFPADTENKDLAVPVLTEDEDAKTATSISVNWTEVDGAESYELLIDGVLNTVGAVSSYTHTELAYASSHTYRVRARNAEGYSAWSEEQTFTSDDDPWKDTPDPIKITWTGSLYNSQGPNLAFDKIFQGGDAGFHSGGNDMGKTLTVEYAKAYKLDKIEYYPRSDAGNGTVTKMKLETSLDGIHWKEEGTYNWNQDASAKVMDLNSAARFIRFTPLASHGSPANSFFSAREIKVCKAPNSKGFAVGSTLGNEEVQEGDYQNLKQYKGSSEKDTIFETQVRQGSGDVNMNGYYDAYDYAFTMFQLDGGTKKTGSVGGTSTVTASKEQVAEGEEFTLAFQVSGAGNVNALGQIIAYDPSKVEYVSVERASAISQMEDLTVNKVYEDGTAFVNIAFANRGDKALYSGSDRLVTLTMRAKKTISTSDENVITPYGLVLIGPDYSTNGEIASDPITVIRQYTQDDFDITMTNAELTEDDGTNVTRLIQQKKYDGLFNGAYGTSDNRDFEFLWDLEGNYDPDTGKLPTYVTLPLTMNLKLKTPGTVGKLIVHNANKGNGFVTSVKANVHYEDETSEEKTITLESNANFATFTFEDIFTPVKNVESVDLTFLKAIDSSDAEVTNMLTLSEIEVFEAEPVDPEDPPIGPNDPDPENPLAPGKKYAQNDFNLTITNDEMPTDEDGNNVQTLINQKSFDGLFDGAIGRDFELLWNIQDNWVDGKLPSYIKVPFTIHLGFKESAPVSQIAVYNANRANGYVTAISAKVNYADGTSTKERIRKLEGDDHTQYPNNHAFVLKYAEDKDVASIDITVLRAIVGDTGEITKNMTTLAEIEVSGVFSNQELLDKIEEYSNVTNPDELYTTATWEKFQTELEKLNGLTDSEDQAAVDKAVADAEKAYKALKTNRSDLESEYNKRKDLSNEDGRFTKESFEKFQAELKKAEELLGNEASTGTACKAAKEALAAAFQALVQLDRSALLEKISEYEVLTNEDGAYTAASWDAFQKAIKDARGVLESLDATQAQIDAAVPALTAAFEALVLNRTVVETEVKKFEAIQNTDNSYTADSWNVFQAALKRAQDTLADPNATPAAINEAFAGLQTAFQALKKADSGIVQPPAPDPAKELKKGDKVVSGGVQYKVLNASKKTAVAAKIDSKSKNAKSITIKATVTIKGVSCKVTEISTGAFKNAKNLSSVTIGKNVKTIGKNAFNGCTKLSKVTFKGTSVPAIKTGAFKKTKSGMTVKVPKKMTKAKRRQLSKKMASTGAKKLKLK
ncbi:MAG: leucine-rich repeat protein [Eubacterium sp.]|jgi:alpha-glucosidase (family GH31 glycosyl hydrolase)|nr:leucine-rich repeat protein [Eubacterium sp.]